MTKAHPITVEVVRNAVVAYADEMANVLAKSAYNMMIYEVRDYCCGLLDVKGRMISQNRGACRSSSPISAPRWRTASSRYRLNGFKPGDIMCDESWRGVRPASEQCVIYAPCFPRGACGLCGQPRPLGGYRRHAAGLRSSATTEITAKVCSPLAQDLRGRSAMRRCGRSCATTSRYPDASLGDLERRSPPAKWVRSYAGC